MAGAWDLLEGVRAKAHSLGPHCNALCYSDLAVRLWPNKMFATSAENAYDFGPNMESVVADYLAANAPYTPKLEGRITQ